MFAARRIVSAGAWLRMSFLPAAGSLALTGALMAAAQPAQAQASATSVPGALNGVDAVSASNVWAVGYDRTGTLILHWDGSAWSKVKSPQLFDGVLDAVSMVSPSNGWAAGDWYNDSTFKSVGLLLHWNGTKWARVALPSGTSGMTGVDMVSATDGWAVGADGSTHEIVMLHWNGTQWTQVPTPGDGAEPTTVEAMSASNAWAVGSQSAFPAVDNLAEHWNGTSWTQVATPNPGTYNGVGSVSATSASNAWAVGGYTPATGPDKTLTLRWDGTAWTQVPSPNPGNVSQVHGADANALLGVAALSASNAWSVGDYMTRAPQGQQAPELPLVLHWNGTKWAKITVPGTFTDTGLTGISMLSRSDGWAVGENYSTVEILHWNGTTWAQS